MGPYDARQFRKTGIFPLHTIEELTARSSKYLSSAKFVKLLEHLHIIAPIRGKSGEVKNYFMPCVLSHAAHKGSIREGGSIKIPPLFITFRCGYCPKGVLSALIVHLMLKYNNGRAKITWQLNEDKLSRDQVCFNVGQALHTVSITTHCTHLEVLVQYETQVSADLLWTSLECNSIQQCIDEGIVAVSKTLHYSCDSAFRYSFYCTHSSYTKPHDHLAVCYHNDPIAMVCSKSRKPCDLPKNCHVWFGHPVSTPWLLLNGKNTHTNDVSVRDLYTFRIFVYIVIVDARWHEHWRWW